MNKTKSSLIRLKSTPHKSSQTISVIKVDTQVGQIKTIAYLQDPPSILLASFVDSTWSAYIYNNGTSFFAEFYIDFESVIVDLSPYISNSSQPLNSYNSFCSVVIRNNKNLLFIQLQGNFLLFSDNFPTKPIDFFSTEDVNFVAKSANKFLFSSSTNSFEIEILDKISSTKVSNQSFKYAVYIENVIFLIGPNCLRKFEKGELTTCVEEIELSIFHIERIKNQILLFSANASILTILLFHQGVLEFKEKYDASENIKTIKMVNGKLLLLLERNQFHLIDLDNKELWAIKKVRVGKLPIANYWELNVVSDGSSLVATRENEGFVEQLIVDFNEVKKDKIDKNSSDGKAISNLSKQEVEEKKTIAQLFDDKFNDLEKYLTTQLDTNFELFSKSNLTEINLKLFQNSIRMTRLAGIKAIEFERDVVLGGKDRTLDEDKSTGRMNKLELEESKVLSSKERKKIISDWLSRIDWHFVRLVYLVKVI